MPDLPSEGPSWSAGYPLFIDLRGRRVVVIGGGGVAERKIATLLEYGAVVRVISPDATEGIRRLADDGSVEWEMRCYAQGDLAGCQLAFCACGDCAAEERIWDEARACGCLLNVVDVPDRCDFIVPSILSRGPLRIAVSTSGTAPTEAKGIRRALEASFDESWGAYLELMGQVRLLIKGRIEGSDLVRKPYFESACALDWRERLASGEEIDPERAYLEVVESVPASAREAAASCSCTCHCSGRAAKAGE